MMSVQIIPPRKKVYVVGDFPNSWGDLKRMFFIQGWSVTLDPGEADLIQFDGGEDVDPSYYGEEKHATTFSNPKRDALEAHIFNQYISTPKTGICRGGQFLNVMSGGKMWQHVDGHLGNHIAKDIDGMEYIVTSTHHQMMKPSDEGIVFLSAKKSKIRETSLDINVDENFEDVEGVFYPHTNSMCFQPHPEYTNPKHLCWMNYFENLNKWLGV